MSATDSDKIPTKEELGEELLKNMRDGSLDKINELISKGADVNYQGPSGFTPLIVATAFGKADIVNLLLNKGADINYQNQKDKSYFPALIWAIQKNNPEMVELLIGKGADVNVVVKYGNSPLTHAVDDKSINIKIIKDLLEAGANINHQNVRDRTAINIVSIDDNIEIAKLLLENNADVNIGDEYKDTPLHWASTFGRMEIVKLLLKNGANVNAIDNIGDTPLMWAARRNTDETYDLVKLLIDNGADRSIVNKKGQQAYEITSNFKLKKLLKPVIRFPINITKTTESYDPIEMETIKFNIGEYIAEDPDNIILMYEKNKYFPTKYSTVLKQIKDNNFVFYGCKTVEGMLNPENIDKEQMYLNLNSIGFPIGGIKCDFNKLIDNQNHQLFGVYNTNKSYPSFVSLDVMEGGDMVSALHCQSGQDAKISKIVVCYPSIKDNTKSMNDTVVKVASSGAAASGGGKKRRTKKHKSRYSKNKRRTRKNKKHTNKK